MASIVSTVPFPGRFASAPQVRTSRCQRSLQTVDLGFEAGGKTILDKVSMTLSPSGLTVLLGPNGAGKSVFLRLANGLLLPTRGTVRWGDDRPTDATRLTQSFVFQRPVLLRRSALDNVAFVLKLRGVAEARGKARSLLDAAGLGALADRPARVLSGGEQQRLAIVRALATGPGVLLLDEPTASLDPASVAAVEALIRSAESQGVKVILVTHDVAQARRLAHDVVFLSGGVVREHTAAADFFLSPHSAEARAYLDGRLIPQEETNSC
ncbi:ATP-binding cassette domain-containing protein [Chthonobacter albigriseus]|uniref:ATP-binding cassette domain-containing protein n=1 Tax=Chthonobacter albigriseus TaxID=1683161 RepID=UPI0015EE3F60|nr:ATP-binding cassette domain-containing protein [Chthonobacter albigriseus]